MEQTVYADILFLVNFSMDFLVFYVRARVCKRRIRLLRTLAASALGGAYSVAAIFADMPSFASLALDLCMLFVMCAVADLSCAISLGGFLAGAAAYAGTAAAIGGIMTALYSLINRLEFLPGDAEGDDVSVWLFALLAAAGAAATLIGDRRKRTVAAAKSIEVELSLGGKVVRFTGIADSGNLLGDALSGRPVAVCELDAVKNIFSPRLVEFWRSGDLRGIEILSRELASTLRYIPARGAVGGASVLTAVAVDKTILRCDGEEKEVDVLIAPVPRKLRGGAALIPAGLI